MLPFLEITALPLGPIPIQPFGVLVATGVLLGTSVAVRHAKSMGLSEDNVRYLGMRCVIFGFITCHLLDVFFYTPGLVLKDPWVILRVWEGIASYGGILGATIAFSVYAQMKNLHYLRYGDSIVYGFVLGFTFGRMGCATAHDHLGRQTDFFLGVKLPLLNRCKDLVTEAGLPDLKAAANTMGCQNWKLPDGSYSTPGHMITAHDLGLYEVFICSALFVVLTLVIRFWKTRRPGTIVAIAALTYPPIRFCLDFLRFPENDPKYWGLTPAQHLCIWTVIGGFVTINAMRKPYNKELMQPPGTDPLLDEAKSEDQRPATGGAQGVPKKKAKVVRKKKKK